MGDDFGTEWKMAMRYASIFRKNWEPKPIDMAFEGTTNLKRMHGRTITRTILSCCMNVVFSNESWGGLIEEERDAVVWSMESPSADANLSIDPFKGSHWTLL